MNKFWHIINAVIIALHKLVLTLWRASYTAKNLRQAFA